MRILSRPMFKYGGPIREGIMHGMRNGGRAALVGNPVYPQTGGREHHRINLSWLGIGAKPAAGVASKPGFIRTQAPKAWEKIKGIFGSTTPATGELYKTPFKPSSFNVHPYWARDPLVKSAVWTKGALTSPAAKNIGEKIVQGIASPTGIGLTLVGTKWLWPDGKEANKVEIEEHLNTIDGKVPGHGDEGMTYTDPSKAEALAKAARKARLDKYLDTMGYDKAKKTAMGDALIDASAIVQEGTSEAGSLKEADWGKMINKAIQATSKRLDKPEQIREAVGLMMTKTDIEKEASAEEDALNKIAKQLQIKIGQKELAGKTTGEILQAKLLKGDYPQGTELASMVRINNPGLNIKVLPSKDIKAGVDALDYVTETIKAYNDNPETGTYPAGVYVIKNRIIKVDETGTVTPIPISSLN